tara:strand:- start:7662 stop:8597 length:936 start_codon:yes stop_codon:yes gene_type:complete
MDEKFFEDITQDKSYLLGFISSHPNLNDSKITLKIFDQKLRYQLEELLDTKNSFEIDSIELIKKIKTILDDIEDNEENIKYPMDFVRGYYDANGYISYDDETKTECIIEGKYIELIKNIIKIPCLLSNDKLIYDSVNIIDFLGKIYYDKNLIMSEYNYNEYVKLLGYKELPLCKVFKTNKNAIIPSKVRESDVGYDLTIIKEHKILNQRTKLYDTGIKLQVKEGFYAEIYPRSSLSKSGYMLANSVGIIDRGYTNNIYVALIKIDDSVDDIKLPFKCCQVIFRKQHYMNIIETDKDFNETDRNLGGFGSTS